MDNRLLSALDSPFILAAGSGSGSAAFADQRPIGTMLR
jgi:hypothetical protein